MELKQLETFLTLSKLCNFTKTAEELHYAQSNVSCQIQKLEAELGCPLFNRIGHKVMLTQKGEEFIPYAKSIVSLSRNAKEQLSDCTKGKLVIAASESLCIYELPQLMQTYQHLYPDTELFLQMVDTTDYAELLALPDVDLAYVVDTPIQNPLIKTYDSRPVTIGLFSTPNHPLAQETSISLSRLAEERFILTRSTCCYRKQFEELMAAQSLTIAMETSSLQAIKELTLSGFGICLLPVMAVKRELQNGQLIQLPISIETTIQSQLISHKDKWISPEAELFIELHSTQLI